MTSGAVGTARSAEAAALTALMKRADGGDAEALAAFMQALDKYPALAQQLGSSWLRSRNRMIEAVVGEGGSVKTAAAERYVTELSQGMVGPCPSTLERAIAARCALALYELDHLTTVVACNLNANSKALDLLDRRRSRAHSRAMSAARTLAVVRRLLSGAPSVAVGVQVNVAGSPPAAGGPVASVSATTGSLTARDGSPSR